MIDLVQMAAEKKGVKAGWRWCKISTIGMPEDYIRVWGSVPIGTIRSGPRKGRPKWPKEKDLETVFIRRKDMDALAEEWERETGVCHICEGSRKQQYGWSKKNGAMFRDCDRCKGTGIAGAISVNGEQQ